VRNRRDGTVEAWVQGDDARSARDRVGAPRPGVGARRSASTSTT
jgi:acylphosphatase